MYISKDLKEMVYMAYLIMTTQNTMTIEKTQSHEVSAKSIWSQNQIKNFQTRGENIFQALLSRKEE